MAVIETATYQFRRGLIPLAALATALFVAGCTTVPETAAYPDRLETGMQGETLAQDNPGSILERPYSKGVRVVGHSDVWGRDSNVQLAWAGHCAYISSTGGDFPIIGTTDFNPELGGVAVIDVSDPSNPRAVRLLRDRGSIAAAETMHAVSAPGRKVLVAGAYHGGENAAGTSGTGHDPEASAAWLDIYDVSDCTNPKLMAEVKWPENSHTLRLSPDGRLVYGTNLSPFTGEGGIQVMDISDMANPRFLGKFGATRADGTTFEFAPHEVSFSPDGQRVYAAVNSSLGGDLNKGMKIYPPNRESLGPNGGGVYIFDNSDFIEGRADPKLRLIGVVPGGGWHSVMPAKIGGVPHLVGGAELGACPGTWPKIINIADETSLRIVGEFRLAMNHAENCPPPSPAESGSSGIIASPGTATLHFNDVDSPTNTRLGLFQFLWGGLRIIDLRDPANPVEVAYFKPGDACGGHVRYVPETGHIWMMCGQSGFYVLELKPQVRASLGLPALAE